MAITLRSDITGTFGAIALNGVDRIKVDTSGVVTFTGSTVYSGGLDGTPIGSTTRSTGAFTGLTNAALTSGRVTYAGTGGLLQDSANLTFNGTTLTSTGFAGPISGVVTSTSITDSGLTSGRVTYAGTAGLLTDSANMTFNGTTLTLANDASISGLTVGKGGGAVFTNTAVGLNALATNASAGQVTAVGWNAANLTTVGGVTAIGSRALATNSTGSSNTALGTESLYLNTTGASNTAIGHSALTTNTTASNNTAVGYQALYSNNATYNTAVGFQAGYNTTGIGINAFGGIALFSNTTGTNNYAFGGSDATAIGAALYANTTGSLNSAFGGAALGSNTTGSNNSAFGVRALQSNTTASNNTAVGYLAGFANTTGEQNVYFGSLVATTNSTGSRNTIIGYGAGAVCTSSDNVIIGRSAGASLTTGGDNTFIGARGTGGGAGYAVTTGSKNTILGQYTGNQGGLDIRTASNYIVLSDGDGNPLAFTANSKTFALQGGTISSGTGITFPATQSASSDANTLDDYEEGTFTPTLSGTSIVYANQVGSYTKIGRMVYVQGYISISSGSPTGSINGLPFTSNAGGSAFSMGMNIYFSGGLNTFPTGGTQVVTYVAPSNTSIILNAQGTAVNAVGFTSFSSTTSLYFTGCYQST